MKPTLQDLKTTAGYLLVLHHILLGQLAKMRGIPTHCVDCKEPLSDDELFEAVEERIKEPACDKCYQKLQKERAEEQKHPDEK